MNRIIFGISIIRVSFDEFPIDSEALSDREELFLRRAEIVVASFY